MLRFLIKLVLTLPLLVLIAFGAFGFLAAAEVPQYAWVFRLIYGALVVGCLGAMVAVWRAPRPRRRIGND